MKDELQEVQDRYEEELETRSDAQRKLVDVTKELEHVKHLYEVEALQKIEELEDSK